MHCDIEVLVVSVITDSFREKNKNIQQELDQTIESYEDSSTDTAHVMEYDAARLEKKIEYLDGKTLQTSKSEISCFAERANVASCYSQNKETTGCDTFIEALTE